MKDYIILQRKKALFLFEDTQPRVPEKIRLVKIYLISMKTAAWWKTPSTKWKEKWKPGTKYLQHAYRELISNIYKEVLKIKRKSQATNKGGKKGKRNKQLAKEEIQMAKKHM